MEKRMERVTETLKGEKRKSRKETQRLHHTNSLHGSQRRICFCHSNIIHNEKVHGERTPDPWSWYGKPMKRCPLKEIWCDGEITRQSKVCVALEEDPGSDSSTSMGGSNCYNCSCISEKDKLTESCLQWGYIVIDKSYSLFIKESDIIIFY